MDMMGGPTQGSGRFASQEDARAELDLQGREHQSEETACAKAL